MYLNPLGLVGEKSNLPMKWINTGLSHNCDSENVTVEIIHIKQQKIHPNARTVNDRSATPTITPNQMEACKHLLDFGIM